jgi:transposase-like protein
MMRKAVENRRWFMMSPPRKKRRMVLLIGFKRRRPMEKREKSEVERPGMEGNKRRRKGCGYTAEEKCRAVLSVWTERRKQGEVCRELGVGWTLLSQWQARAIEGMLLALQPRVPMEKGVALSPRLAVLLERKSKRGAMKGLERRLAQLQSKTRLSEKSPSKSGETQEIGA